MQLLAGKLQWRKSPECSRFTQGAAAPAPVPLRNDRAVASPIQEHLKYLIIFRSSQGKLSCKRLLLPLLHSSSCENLHSLISSAHECLEKRHPNPKGTTHLPELCYEVQMRRKTMFDILNN